jgi:hypothetical protein
VPRKSGNWGLLVMTEGSCDSASSASSHALKGLFASDPGLGNAARQLDPGPGVQNRTYRSAAWTKHVFQSMKQTDTNHCILPIEYGMQLNWLTEMTFQMTPTRNPLLCCSSIFKTFNSPQHPHCCTLALALMIY